MPLGCCDDDCQTLAVGIPGPPGPTGPAGPQGPPGSGGAAEYIHTQSTPSSSWTIAHNLNKQIVGALVYSLDMATQYDTVFVEQLDANTCRLWVSPPLSGIARIY